MPLAARGWLPVVSLAVIRSAATVGIQSHRPATPLPCRGHPVFEPLFELFSGLLSWFYDLVPSYGFAIIMLTLTVMVLITPLTYKSTKSMLQMQRLQPEMKKIQQRYKDDREKMNQEMLKFYQENSINPVGGCLPMFFQMPFFILLYQTLQGLTAREGGTASGVGHLAGQFGVGQQLTNWRSIDQPFSPTHLTDGTLRDALTHTNEMRFLGFDLAISPQTALRIGIGTAIPFAILMFLIFAVQWYQNQQIQGRQKRHGTGQEQPAQLQLMMKIMPFMLPVFSFGFPAGLSVYWLVQGLCRVATQSFITKSLYGPDSEHAKALAARQQDPARGKATKDEPKDKKPGTSARSQAVQKKAQGGPTAAGSRPSGRPASRSAKSSSRKSGDPR